MGIVKGGQGRSAGEVRSNGEHFGWFVLLVALLLFSAMACHRPWTWNQKDIKREKDRADYHGIHE